MGTLKQGNKTLVVYWMFAILILCVGFIFIGCGSGISPQEKVVNPNAVQNAIDFTDCTGTFCRVLVVIEDLSAASNPIDARPLTVESWVKLKPTSSSPESGGIMGRLNTATGGVVMYVKNDVPKFVILYKDPSLPTSTEYTVSSSVSLTDVWTHIAGVLSTIEHDDVTDHNTLIATCDAGVGAEKPHLDIYINGTFAGCATTDSNFATSPGTKPMGVGVWGESGTPIDGITPTTPFNGIIDEVRLWGVERTSAEINACMNQDLGLTGNCNYMNVMAGYMRFNEGQGATTTDWSGLGSGVKEFMPDAHQWTAGWSTDTPF